MKKFNNTLALISLLFFVEEALAGGDSKSLWQRWVQSAMGLKSSPYNTIQGMLMAEEVIRGNPQDPGNVFRWSRVRLNLPVDPCYDSSLPWVSKIRDEDGRIACDFVGYVDDLRSGGNGWTEACAASRRIASLLNWLGAARKRRGIGDKNWSRRERACHSYTGAMGKNERYNKLDCQGDGGVRCD
jgi:hypothetical protein